MFRTLKYILPFALILLSFSEGLAQGDTVKVNQDAIYNRPFINLGQSRTAVGGYLEGNTNYFSEDGISDGFSMEMRRFNIFLYAPIGNRIRFLSELEFEHGTKEIAIETALLDFDINTGLVFRAGIILPAIGIFNTNHDSPNWEFIDRPLSSTGIIPSTLSEVGFGFHGKFYPNDQSILSYDAYLVNGLRDNIILNAEGRTHFGSGKSEEMFAEDNNGTPMFNGRVSYGHRKLGELGLSYYGGTYNTFRLDGAEIDSKRNMALMAVDLTTNLKKLSIKGEVVLANVDVPDEIQEIYGEQQFGGFVDVIYPIFQGKMLRFENAVLNAAIRYEHADFNVGNFTTNVTENIADDNTGLVFGLSFRPRPGTVLRFNYQRHWIRDALGNPAVNLAGFQFGFASYF